MTQTFAATLPSSWSPAIYNRNTCIGSAKIEHPAIMPVYEYGKHENNLYLVMRYRSGDALSNKLRNGVLTLQEATQIISQGVVHRDLKPGKILVDLLQFGLMGKRLTEIIETFPSG